MTVCKWCVCISVSIHTAGDKGYQYQSAVYKVQAAGAGDDVGIYARGPWAHLFTGTHEQNDIAHMVAYASCVGDYTTDCPPELTKSGPL